MIKFIIDYSGGVPIYRQIEAQAERERRARVILGTAETESLQCALSEGNRRSKGGCL